MSRLSGSLFSLGPATIRDTITFEESSVYDKIKESIEGGDASSNQGKRAQR